MNVLILKKAKRHQMTHQEFQKYYEDHSEHMYEQLNGMDEAALLALIAGTAENTFNIWKGGDNYQVWRVLAEKGTGMSIKPLFDIVTNLKNDYLVRYHACTALFSIAGINDEDFIGQVQYGLDKNRQPVDQQQAFKKLQNILDSK